MRIILIALFVSWYATTAHAEYFTAIVHEVHDGDTLTAIYEDGTMHHIRMLGIDAPELKQPFGIESRNNLIALTKNAVVVIEVKNKDRYGRELGEVWVQGIDAGRAQVQSGMAWWYDKYASNQSEFSRDLYSLAHSRAKRYKVGLWRQNKPQSPWDFRHNK